MHKFKNHFFFEMPLEKTVKMCYTKIEQLSNIGILYPFDGYTIIEYINFESR